MKIIFALLMLWSLGIGATIELTKASFKSSGKSHILDRFLALLPFAYGGMSGYLFADAIAYTGLILTDLATEDQLLSLMDMPEFPWLVAGLGLGVGAVAGQVYKAAKDTAPETVRRLMDWWR